MNIRIKMYIYTKPVYWIINRDKLGWQRQLGQRVFEE